MIKEIKGRRYSRLVGWRRGVEGELGEAEMEGGRGQAGGPLVSVTNGQSSTCD